MEPHCIVPCQPLEEDCRPVYQLIHKHVARHTPKCKPSAGGGSSDPGEPRWHSPASGLQHPSWRYQVLIGVARSQQAESHQLEKRKNYFLAIRYFSDILERNHL